MENGDVYSAYQMEYHYDLFQHLPDYVYVGTWYDNSKTELSDGSGEACSGNYGFTTGFQQMLYRRNCHHDPEDRRGSTMFAQYSSTKRDRNKVKVFWNLGFHWFGLYANRPEDILGLAMNTVRFSNGFRVRENLPHSFETAYEIFLHETNGKHLAATGFPVRCLSE